MKMWGIKVWKLKIFNQSIISVINNKESINMFWYHKQLALHSKATTAN